MNIAKRYNIVVKIFAEQCCGEWIRRLIIFDNKMAYLFVGSGRSKNGLEAFVLYNRRCNTYTCRLKRFLPYGVHALKEYPTLQSMR